MNKLLKALKCENEQVKAAALVALIRLNKCKLVKEEIIETFESTSELLQLVGILGLTELMIKDERLTAKLLKYLESENVWIQFAAGQALKKLVEPDQENLPYSAEVQSPEPLQLTSLTAFDVSIVCVVAHPTSTESTYNSISEPSIILFVKAIFFYLKVNINL